MRGFTSYIVAGILVAIATAFIAPLAGLSLTVGARSTVEGGYAVQSVNRSHKGDRLMLPAAAGQPQVPVKSPASKSPTVLVGCEPVFSPLSASAHAILPNGDMLGLCVV